MPVENGPRYRVLEKLGQGGMGVVHRAEDRLLRRPIAFKFFPEIVWPDGVCLPRSARLVVTTTSDIWLMENFDPEAR